MDWVANRYINYRCHGRIGNSEQRPCAFTEADPIRSRIAEMKDSQGVAYKTELSRLEKDDNTKYRASLGGGCLEAHFLP